MYTSSPAHIKVYHLRCLAVKGTRCQSGDGYRSNVIALNNSVDPIPLMAKVTALLTASKNGCSHQVP